MNTYMLRRPSRMLALQICLAKCLVRHTTSLACARVIALLASLTAFLSPAMATEHARSIIVQSTTSTQNSGFYRHITPAFTAETGIAVRVIAVGTGQALKNAQNCDGDLVIVHARDAEMRFIEKGYGLQRRELMYNDFVIIGPPDDTADIGDAPDTNTALQRIAATTAPFASRGDASGTHIKERALWRAANVDPQADIDGWYRETGNGMGATLNYSVQSYSYTLTDRATWLAFGNRFDHKILVEGDPALFNQYAIVSINPAHCPSVAGEDAEIFADWLLSPRGQTHIAKLTRKGQQLFFPNAATQDGTD